MPIKWSQVVNEDSDALGLEEGVSRKRARPKLPGPSCAPPSKAVGAKPPPSTAMSMLTFYINCARDNAPCRGQATMERAKK